MDIPKTRHEYPNADAALQHVATATNVPVPTSYNWTYNDPIAVNFTAVEIITFLPDLYHNFWMANRFINNHISNPVHIEIHAEHRHDSHSMTLKKVGSRYLTAMRGRNWKQVKKQDAESGRTTELWDRKTHLTPIGWNPANIAMNGFMVDLDAENMNPASVPFISLLHNVKKIPQGFDAADLTRAIDYVAFYTSQEACSGKQAQTLMFPDHLKDVLDTIGRTQISPEHLDLSVAMRYGRKVQDKRYTSTLNLVQNDPVKQIIHLQALTHPPDPQSARVHPTPHPQSTPSLPDTTPLHDGPAYRGMALIRDSEVYEYAMDNRSFVIRFAQRPSQRNMYWHWTMDHVQQIHTVLKAEAAEGIHCYDMNMSSPLDEVTSVDSIMTTEEYHDLFGNDVPYPSPRSPTPGFLEPLNLDAFPPSTDEHLAPLYPSTHEDCHGYAPEKLLRECPEGDNPDDQSFFAQAVRTAKCDVDTEWMVRDLHIMEDLLWLKRINDAEPAASASNPNVPME
ncbi:hypothetical protein P280DRAFT_484559 [Massarina eburnea CBS 473.64]|uniref:Uncharacterized protein n=1 Tax=Massarina eburnea CBS 473.64 TaxID=1395130 RepID=A0A6A6RK26_9PLEO|nr:hypothetical protein P280DRAFT_484559 [Massarina eburnea CBS 473.64]